MMGNYEYLAKSSKYSAQFVAVSSPTFALSCAMPLRQEFPVVISIACKTNEAVNGFQAASCILNYGSDTKHSMDMCENTLVLFSLCLHVGPSLVECCFLPVIYA